MDITLIQGISPIQGTSSGQGVGNGSAATGASFGAFLDKMEQDEVGAQNKLAGYINGSSSFSIHDVMLDIERNRLMLSLALQVRNKMVEGVQELFRTPI